MSRSLIAPASGLTTKPWTPPQRRIIVRPTGLILSFTDIGENSV
jgi:hypothetical protein